MKTNDKNHGPESPVPWYYSMGWGFSLSLFIAIAIPLGFLVYFAHVQFSSALKSEVMTGNSITAMLTSRAIDEEITKLMDYISNFSKRPSLISAIQKNDASKVDAELLDLFENERKLDRAFIIDSKGIEMYACPSESFREGTDWSSEIWYQKVARSQQSIISEVYPNPPSDMNYHLIIATPIQGDKSRLLGYLVIGDSLDNFEKMFFRSPHDIGGIISLIDQFGKVIFPVSLDDQKLLSLEEIPLYLDALTGHPEVMVAYNPITETDNIIATHPVHSVGWAVLSSQPMNVVDAPLEKVSHVVLGLAIFSLFGMFAVGYYWSNCRFVYQMERQRSAHKLLQKTEQLARAHAELEQLELFAFVSTHDLQEPLHKITLFNNLLNENAAHILNENGKDYLNRMRKAIDQMRGLIEELHDFVRLSTTQNQIVAVDLNQVLNEVLKNLDASIKTSGAYIETGLLPIIYTDRIKFSKVLENLLSNALKFHKKNENPSIKIECRQLQGSVEISVIDYGLGFEERYLDKLFKPFQKLHRDLGLSGYGLGLATCRKILLSLGGDIRAQSTLGKETIFTVTLPVD